MKKGTWSVTSPEQVRHSDRQVTSMEEVKVGSRYIYHFADGRTGEVVVTSVDYSGQTPIIWVWENRSQGRFFATDVGIVPYGVGKWNPTNYLEFAS